jgi:hypothetical protein
MKSDENKRLSGGLLRGAEQIAGYIFGDQKGYARDKKKYARRVYALVENGVLPRFYLGREICARPPALEKWIADQEAAHGDSA